MAIEIKIDGAPFEEQARKMEAAQDQMPFALSRALNDAANDAYNFIIDQTWPRAVTVRASGFMRWALRTKFSTKYDLCVEIYDNTSDARAHLALHAEGGTKNPRKGHLAIPSNNVTRTANGVAADQRPANLAGKVVIGNKIYQRVGRGKNSALKLMYVLAKSARQPMDVPFKADFQTEILQSASQHFIPRMKEAMNSRK